MTRYFRFLVQLGLGIAILLWLLQLAGISRVLGSIQSLTPFHIILASVLFIIASVMIALALYLGLRGLKLKTSVRNVVMTSFAGQLLSDVTPARSGYFLTPFILNKMDGTPVESGMASVVATGVANFFVKAVLSLIALLYFISFLPLDPTILSALLVSISLVIAGGLGLSLLIWGRHLPKPVEKLARIPLLGGIVSKVVKVLNKLQEEGRKVRRSFMQITLLTLLSVVANAAALYTISISLWHTSPSFHNFILMVSLASVLIYIPITIAGLGVQEGCYVMFLTLLGMPLEEAIAFALIVRVLFTGTDIIGLQPLLKVGIKTTLKEKN